MPPKAFSPNIQAIWDSLMYQQEQLHKKLEETNKKQQELKSDVVSDVASEILEKFEELLDFHNISIPDVNREGNTDEARLFGDAYYSLENEIKQILIKYIK